MQILFICYLCDLNHVTSFEPYNYTLVSFLLELDILVKYLSWFKIKFRVAFWN